MAKTNAKHPLIFQSLLIFLFCAVVVLVQDVTGSRVQMLLNNYPTPYHTSSPKSGINLKEDNSRRILIGSVAPICTYNECRGCKYRCRAEQVPVEGNDPINSAYHYKCVCHR